MSKVQTTGIAKRTLKSDPRSKSSIEAEKGETIVTNTGIDNILEHFTIEGQKHSNGGTPLDVPAGSFVFSDKKEMKIKDKELLEFFGESAKKALTPATIAKKYDLNDLKMKLKDPNIDPISRNSLEMTFENSLVKLSALAIIQESLKGTPQGHSKMFDSFMERTGMEPGQLLGTSGAAESALDQATKMAFGGVSDKKKRSYYYADGGGTEAPFKGTPPYQEWEAYTPKGAKQLNSYLQLYGLPLVNDSKVSEREMKEAVNNLQLKIIGSNPELVYDYMTTNPDGSHQPNNKLEDILKGKGYSPDKAGLVKAMQEGTLSKDEVLKGYNDQKWWYRAVTSEKKRLDKADYDKWMQENPSGIRQGDYVYFRDQHNPENYIAYYTDENGNPTKPVPADPKKPDEPITVSAKHLGQGMEDRTNMDFYFQDKNNLKNIQRKRMRLKKYDDFTPTPELGFTDQAYYSPEQAIHAVASQLSSGVSGMTAFGDQQSQTANFSQMQGQAFSQVAQVIGDYADRNVAAYNNERAFNTEVANKKALLNSESARSSYVNRVNADKAWTRDLNLLDDMLTAGINKAVSNRADRINLEKTVGEQYKIDPNTGIVYFDKGRALNPSSAGEDDMADEINDLMTKVPGLTTDMATKAIIAKKSGKWTLDPNDGMTLPNELPNP